MNERACAHLQLVAQLAAQLLEEVVVLGDDVLGDGLVAAVGLVHEHALLQEAVEQRAQQLGRRHALVQLAQELAAHTSTLSTLRPSRTRNHHIARFTTTL